MKIFNRKTSENCQLIDFVIVFLKLVISGLAMFVDVKSFFFNA